MRRLFESIGPSMSVRRAPHAVPATQRAGSIRVRRVVSNSAACGAGRVAGALENAKIRRVETGHVSRHALAKSLKSFFIGIDSVMKQLHEC